MSCLLSAGVPSPRNADQELNHPGAAIFPTQEKHVHGSSIVQSADGSLLATWFYGAGERTANDVRLQGARRRADDNGWSPVFDMADTPDHPDCNPVLFLDPDQKLWLFWIAVQSNRWERSVLKYRTSTRYLENGAPQWDWQDAILLKPAENFSEQVRQAFDTIAYPEPMWAEYAHAYTDMLVEAAKDPVKRDTGWMSRCKPIVLKNGRWLLPLYSDGYNFGLIARSDDHGATWLPSGPMVGLGANQPSLAQRADGTVVAFVRDDGAAPKRIMQSISTDNGETWSPCTDTEFPNPGASIDVCDLGQGTWVLVYNHAKDHRNNLALAYSHDEGRTWDQPAMLLNSLDGQRSFSYPSAIRGIHGELHLTCSYKGPEGATIYHITVPNE
ncbi:MAG: exo-alpha-sialidase [Candidatus Hydrogenedentes bacterium]|nr:exo-alpha-sialidase [Candidatus Hydrogenedentota bacterium]